MDDQQQRKPWYKADQGRVHELVFPYAAAVEEAQFDMYDRFVKLEALYDPNGSAAQGTDIRAEMMGAVENGIASNVDTVTAIVAATDVRTRFMTDGANWSQQRRARQLEWYIEGLAKLLKRAEKCRMAFTGSAKKGTGLTKQYVNAFDEIVVDHIIVDDIIVDDRQCRNGGEPRDIHQRRIVDREELKAMFPEHEQDIEKAQYGDNGRWTTWAGYRPLAENEVVVLESFCRPFGKKGHDHYVPGRHAITIHGKDLLDDEFEEPCFPYAKGVWTPRDSSWFGIAGAERIMGTQRALNRRNLQIERQNDQYAFPTTYVRQADANLAVKATNRIGTIAVYKSDKPETVFPPAVSPETYKSREEYKRSMDEEFGVSRMVAHGAKPSGLDSGEALREFRDQTTQRFAMQEKMFEQLNLQTDLGILRCCKQLGEKAPAIMKSTKFGEKKINWEDVEPEDLEIMIAAASTLSRTPAGRHQQVIELAQAGIITTDEVRRLTGHPDLEKELSLYIEAIESVEEDLEEIEDGAIVVPEPFQNLKICIWRGQRRYLQLARLPDCPEEVLEGMRQYVVQAIAIQKMQAQQAQNANAQAGGALPGPTAADAALPAAAESPMEAPPVAALAPQAMELRAS